MRLEAITAAAALSRVARNLHVSDGDQAHLKAPLGLVELAGEGQQRAILRRQHVLGVQYCEILRGHARDQILLGGEVIGFAQRHAAAGRLERHPVIPGKQVDLQTEIRQGRCAGGFARDTGPVLGCRAVERQHVQDGLGAWFAARHMQRCSLLHGRVGDERLIVNGFQVLGAGGPKCTDCEE